MRYVKHNIHRRTYSDGLDPYAAPRRVVAALTIGWNSEFSNMTGVLVQLLSLRFKETDEEARPPIRRRGEVEVGGVQGRSIR